MIKHVSLLLLTGVIVSGCSRTRTATFNAVVPTQTTQALVKEITGDAQGARDQAKALRAQSDALLAAKDYSGAMDKRLQMLGFRGKDASTFGMLAASAIQQLALGDVENIASRLDAASCRKYAAQLQSIDAKSPTYAAIMGAEKATEIQRLSTRSSNPRTWKLIISGMGSNAQEQQALDNMPPAQIKKNIENYYNARIQWALQPYGTKWRPISVDPYTRNIIGYLTLGRLIWTSDKNERVLDIAALQARADRLEKKQRSWTLPNDPFGTGPLKQKNGVVYSVGPDTKDDGGQSVPKPKSVQMRDKGDILAPTF